MSCACESGIRIPGGPRAAREARAALTREVGDKLPGDRVRDLNLVLSEVVNNSVLHGHVDEDGWIDIEYTLSGSGIRVEVKDSGRQGVPKQREPDYESGGGFGLFIVDAMCTHWGVEREPVLRVWFELGLDGTS